jgi:hypothetical protein
MEKEQSVKLLKAAFIAGAIIDAAALVPMLWPWAARQMWGFDAAGGPYRYAMQMGAALMLGWTLLLIWAARRPVERRFVAVLTMVVIIGIALAEIMAVAGGVMALGKALPSFALQAVLLALFGIGYAVSSTSR